MTPYMLLMPTTPPAATPAASAPSKENFRDNKGLIDDSSRIARRTSDSKDADSKRTSEADTTSDIKNKNDKRNTASEPTLFEQLMASLLNMPSPAQTQPTVTVRPNGETNIAASSTSQFGVPFNMDPALLVLPSNVQGDTNGNVSTLAPVKDGSGFSAELLAALTPGIPAPTTDQTALMSQIETSAAITTVAATAVTMPVAVTTAPVSTPVQVPVPIISEDATITPLLTVANDVDADPRLVACGFNPVDMGKFKDKLASLTKTNAQALTQIQTSIEAPAQPVVQTPTPQIPAGQAAAQQTPPSQPTKISTDNGIISVSFTMPKPQPVVVPAPSQPIVQAQAQSTVIDNTITNVQNAEAALSVSVAADTNIKADTASSKISDAAAQQAISSSESGSDNFDPVEFRIAQSFQKGFQRPVSTPVQTGQNQPTGNGISAPANQQPAPGVSITAPQPQFQHAVNAAINGHVNTMNNDSSSSMMSSLLSQSLATSTGDANLTVSPAALPVTVSPLTSTAIQSTTAAQSHPAVQAVAAVIAKGAKEGGPQTISMRLDPPELGKLQVEMKYKKGDPLKVHVVLEKADTASMFMRDAHALESTLKDAGLQLDGSSLSFEFSGDGTFQQALQGKGAETGVSAGTASSDIGEIPGLEASPDIFTDTNTGLTHYNMRV